MRKKTKTIEINYLDYIFQEENIKSPEEQAICTVEKLPNQIFQEERVNELT